MIKMELFILFLPFFTQFLFFFLTKKKIMNCGSFKSHLLFTNPFLKTIN